MNIGGLSTSPPRALPATLQMLPARPNPSNGVTEVRFVLPTERSVRVDVYDITGRLVRTLRAGEPLPAGEHTASWDGRDAAGSLAAGGMYIMHVRAGSEDKAAKMLLVR